MDKNHDGRIVFKEFSNSCYRLIIPSPNAISVEDKFKLFNQDLKGEIEFDSFIITFMDLKGNLLNDDKL